uniref:Zinc finger AN1-type containing 3 n=1 Tax=Felis catus TaxID=9685 RepID=A0ABI7ZS39_FELCA
MGDAGSERSKAPSLPPRCPCGFWGSSKTMNLCSKCFADFQKKQPDDDSAPSTSNSQSDLFSEETTSDNNNTSITTPTLSPSQQPLPTELNVTSPSKEECGPCTDTAHVSLITPTKRSCGTDSQSENEASPVKRARLLENTERPEETSRSKQKSRRRCFQCQTKLELVQQELGSCRCGYVFCMLHRLPEQHDCTFDHMGRGREEAIMKMFTATHLQLQVVLIRNTEIGNHALPSLFLPSHPHQSGIRCKISSLILASGPRLVSCSKAAQGRGARSARVYHCCQATALWPVHGHPQ